MAPYYYRTEEPILGIPLSIPDIGVIEPILFSEEEVRYTVKLPYKIESYEDIEVDISSMKGLWEKGMVDDLRTYLDEFLET